MTFFAIVYLRPILFLFFLAVTCPPLLGLVWLWKLVESYQPFLSDFEFVFLGIPVMCWIIGSVWLANEATGHLIFDKMPLIKTFKTVFIDAWSIFSFVLYWLPNKSKNKST